MSELMPPQHKFAIRNYSSQEKSEKGIYYIPHHRMKAPFFSLTTTNDGAAGEQRALKSVENISIFFLCHFIVTFLDSNKKCYILHSLFDGFYALVELCTFETHKSIRACEYVVFPLSASHTINFQLCQLRLDGRGRDAGVNFLHRCTDDSWVQLVECGGEVERGTYGIKFSEENYEYSLYFYIEFSNTYFCDTNVGRYLEALWNVQGRNSSQVLGVNKMKWKWQKRKITNTTQNMKFLFEI